MCSDTVLAMVETVRELKNPVFLECEEIQDLKDCLLEKLKNLKN